MARKSPIRKKDEASEHLLEDAIGNAHRNYAALVSTLPPTLTNKEADLVSWYLAHKGNSLTKLRGLFDFMSRAYEHVSKFTPCEKGCNSCCRYNISIRELEIELIERETPFRRNAVFLPQGQFHGMECPFLMKNQCAVYSCRPFVCRRHIALTKTAYWCQPDHSLDTKLPLLAFSEIDRVFDLLIADSSNCQAYDIRQVFGQ